MFKGYEMMSIIWERQMQGIKKGEVGTPVKSIARDFAVAT
jgi:hypothetical protein